MACDSHVKCGTHGFRNATCGQRGHFLLACAADSSVDQPNEELVDFLVREEVARHVTAMWTLERIAAQDWARTRTLMASINQVISSHGLNQSVQQFMSALLLLCFNKSSRLLDTCRQDSIMLLTSQNHTAKLLALEIISGLYAYDLSG